MKKRVCCLYRVSTDKQVYYNDNHEADIPVQRRACHRFADKMGWEIVYEEQEDGVSGYKVRAEKRDKIQIIKELALKKRFDVLLVFMFDRLGRIADETPFVVEWFVKNGIEVWSTEEGEQKFDSHVDKLLNYIRFWQADGESEKISIRTKAGLSQLVEDGHFKGGVAPYGYDLVKSGRLNKRKQEMKDLKVNEAEAKVVQIIFDKYTEEGLGAHRITTWLNENGYRARTGKNWHSASVRGMLQNVTYTGVLRCGETKSDVIEELRIISPEQFEQARAITKERSEASKMNPILPVNMSDKALVSGLVFCGHCGSRLIITSAARYRKYADGTVDKTKRARYTCYGKTSKQTECNGQTVYSTHLLDSAVDKVICYAFAKLKNSSQDQLESQSRNDLETKKGLSLLAKINYEKEKESLKLLKDEAVKILKGESSYSIDVLFNLVEKSEKECERLQEVYLESLQEIEKCNNKLEDFREDYQELLRLGQLYSEATFQAKKVLVHSIVNRIDVFKDYQVKIDFKFEPLQAIDVSDVNQ